MRLNAFIAGVLVCAMAQAQEQEKVYAQGLIVILEQRLAILQKATDQASTQNASTKLHQLQHELNQIANELYEKGSSEANFINYIENTPALKSKLIDLVMLLSIELQRLDAVNFYQVETLKDLLLPPMRSEED